MSDLVTADYPCGHCCWDCGKPILDGDDLHPKRLVGIEDGVPISDDGIVFIVESLCRLCGRKDAADE